MAAGRDGDVALGDLADALRASTSMCAADDRLDSYGRGACAWFSNPLLPTEPGTSADDGHVALNKFQVPA
ncbi:hypothetical protein [Nocardioides sp. GXZ039]|uniref:hypothetical protein n=1 Tax=Nocardioides sp. GXZ039 TaxID=3136018 RepID=UPI0030F4266D